MKLTKDTNLEMLTMHLNELRSAIAVIEITHKVKLDEVAKEMAVDCALTCAYQALEGIGDL